MKTIPDPYSDGTDPHVASTFVGSPDEAQRSAELSAVTGPPAAPPGYEILGILGKGGMGVVYKARQAVLNRPVALKMTLLVDPAETRETVRFLAEAESLAAVTHPHVVRVFEFGNHAGRPFLTMELLDGGSLADRLKQDGRMAPRAAAELVGKLAAAVQAAHDQGIVHRDLKPANVLFDAAGEPRVTDFGLAKRTARADLTQTGAVIGTPAYMAPEQAKGETKFVGPAADVHALGVILFECLTGRRPFDAEFTIALVQKVATEDAPPVRRFAPGAPRDLDLIVRKCLRKEPHLRYATAAALADDLGRFLAGRPTLARPVPAPVRAAKWVRRNKAATAALLALAAGAAGSGWQAVEARRAADRADREAERARGEANKARDEERAKADALGRVLEESARADAAHAKRLEALDAMTDELVDKLFARQPKLGEVEKAFLRKVVFLYKGLMPEPAETPAERAALARLFVRTSRVRSRYGDADSALADLRNARRLQEGLVAEFPTAVQHRADLATTLISTAVFHAAADRPGDAVAAYRAAERLLAGLAADHPDEPYYRSQLALAANNRGMAHDRLAQPDDALGAHRAAVALLEKLAAAYPGADHYRALLAKAHDRRGVVLTGLGRWAEAEAAYRDALDLRQRLVDSIQPSTEYSYDLYQTERRHELAQTRHNLAVLLLDRGRWGEAEEGFRRARDAFQKLVVEFPSGTEYREDLARAHGNLSRTLRRLGRPDDADAESRGQRAALEKLAADFPGRPGYRNDLAGALVNASLIAQERKAYADARRLLEDAVPHHEAALAAQPRNRTFRTFYRNNRLNTGRVLLALGDHAAVPPVAAELVALGVDGATDAYWAAELVAGCVLPARRAGEPADRYADEAVAYLRRAVEQGFKDAAKLRDDPALAPLRGRADFRALAADLTAKHPPPHEPAPPPRPAG